MERMTRPRLVSATVLPNFNMYLVFRNGHAASVDFKPFFAQSKGLLPLRNEQVFAGAEVDPDGWMVEWPDQDIQIGADTLWQDAQAQYVPDENRRVSIPSLPEKSFLIARSC